MKPTIRRFAEKADAVIPVELLHKYSPTRYGTTDQGQMACIVHNPTPCTIIFVHGVNSEGEWYNAAEDLLCSGLNDRLDRHGTRYALRSVKPGPYEYPSVSGGSQVLKNHRPRFDPTQDAAADPYVANFHSPVIRFYWGYKAPQGDFLKPSYLDEADPKARRTTALRRFPVALDEDDAWGGGPFQNGTSHLLAMFDTLYGFACSRLGGAINLQRFNPITDRCLSDAPPRSYMVHAARRLAFLIRTIRDASPHETINVVSHSQGTMVAGLAMLFLQEQGVRGPEALFLCNSPWSLNEPDLLEAVQYGANDQVVSRAARLATLREVALVLAQAARHPAAASMADITRQCLCTPARDAYLGRAEHGRLYVYANPHDRVMGAEVLRSIGWRGLTSVEQQKVAGNVVLRMCAENIELGRGGYVYTMSARAFGIMRDDSGNDTGQVREDFWYPSSERLPVFGPLYAPPTANEAEVYIGAPSLPWYIDAALRADVEKYWPALRGWPGRLTEFDERKAKVDRASGSGLRDILAYKQVFHPRLAITGWRTERDPYSDQATQVPVYASVEDGAALLQAREHNLSDHSTLPQHEFIVRGVMAWDLALGVNQCHTDARFWRYLKTLADWKLSDPYFLDNDEGALPDPGPLPPTLPTDPAWPRQADRAVDY